MAGIRYAKGLVGSAAGAALAFALTACDGGTVGPDVLHFGQVGQVRATVRAPLNGGIGWQLQELTWESGGGWELFEEIGYKEAVGETTLTPNPGVAEIFASSYASFINGVNANNGWKLFGVEGLDSAEEPDCGRASSRVTIWIRDSGRKDETSWTRCASGTLRSLRIRPNEVDLTAARVIQAVIIMRNLTVGEGEELYAYTGSWPFATLDKGDKTGLLLKSSRVFRSDDETGSHVAPPDWEPTWRAHTDSDEPAPDVDWATEMVLLAAIGTREEAGDSVEIRRVLHLGTERGTEIKIVERVPGDFCAPVNQTVRPFHIVLAPRAPAPVRFSEIQVERVTCGV